MVCNEHKANDYRIGELERRMGRIETCIIVVTVAIIAQLWGMLKLPERLQDIIVAEVKAQQAP